MSPCVVGFLFIYLSIYLFRFYLFIHETHRERQRHTQREKQAPCREPDVGLDPGTPGSRPEPKADAQLLSPPDIPKTFYLFIHSFMKIGRDRERQREKQAPCREPDVGLDPGIPGSCSERKAGAQPLHHPGIPSSSHC